MAVFVLQLLVLSVSCVSFVLQFKCIMFRMSMLGMPSKACPFPGTSENLHICCLLLFSIFSTYMLNHVIGDLLYIHTVFYLYSNL